MIELVKRLSLFLEKFNLALGFSNRGVPNK